MTIIALMRFTLLVAWFLATIVRPGLWSTATAFVICVVWFCFVDDWPKK